MNIVHSCWLSWVESSHPRGGQQGLLWYRRWQRFVWLQLSSPVSSGQGLRDWSPSPVLMYYWRFVDPTQLRSRLHRWVGRPASSTDDHSVIQGVHLGRLLTSFDVFWLLLTSFDFFWRLLTSFDFFWLLLTGQSSHSQQHSWLTHTTFEWPMT